MLYDCSGQQAVVQIVMSILKQPCPYALDPGDPDVWWPPQEAFRQVCTLYAASCEGTELQAETSNDVLRAFTAAASLWDRLAGSSGRLTEADLVKDVKVW